MLNIEVGDIVLSIAGRDMGNAYVVYNINGNNASLVDGKGKTVLKPKIKNIKHLKPIGEKDEALKVKFLAKEKVLDAEIRKKIKNF